MWEPQHEHTTLMRQEEAAMDIITAVKSVYSKYATFSGRASRAEYWYFFLFTIIAGAALSAIDSTLATAFSIANVVPNLAVAVRRLHDTNRSGKLIVALILVEVVLFLVIVVSFVAGISGAIGGNENVATGGGIGVLVGVVLFVVLAIYWIYLMAKRGDAGPNRFGDPS
ncbi:MAG: hypothetical protein RL546_67 [Chloroflexota bacterium]|jgi:uncharacterized membrane protein YhaH (DUF805 family)